MDSHKLVGGDPVARRGSRWGEFFFFFFAVEWAPPPRVKTPVRDLPFPSGLQVASHRFPPAFRDERSGWRGNGACSSSPRPLGAGRRVRDLDPGRRVRPPGPPGAHTPAPQPPA